MSKEEKIKRILTTTGYTTEANKHEVLFYIEELERNNFKLQARADKYKCRNDKAIEYLHETSEIELGQLSIYGDSISPYALEKILKGEDNE